MSVTFYRGANGKEPVRDWLKSMDADDRKLIGEDIQTVQFRWPLGLPLVRKMDKRLWEVRSDITDGRIARTFFTTDGDEMILLHGIIKKSNATPPRDLATAKRRRENWFKG